MLTIRRNQMEALKQYMLRQFENGQLSYYRRQYPEALHDLSEERARDAINGGIRRARGYGLRLRYDISRFVNLMFVFGWRFDTDHLWVREILNDTSFRSGTEKMNSLYEAAEKHLAEEVDPQSHEKGQTS